jgi:hypothetical protein
VEKNESGFVRKREESTLGNNPFGNIKESVSSAIHDFRSEKFYIINVVPTRKVKPGKLASNTKLTERNYKLPYRSHPDQLIPSVSSSTTGILSEI